MASLDDTIESMLENYLGGDVRSDMEFYVFKMDSLDEVAFVMEVEERFDITINDSEIPKAMSGTVKDFIDLVNSKLEVKQ